jgi:hypothetical protein
MKIPYALAAMFYNSLINPHHLYMVPEPGFLITPADWKHRVNHFAFAAICSKWYR